MSEETPHPVTHDVLRALLVVFVVFLGVAAIIVMVKTRPQPGKRADRKEGTLVEVIAVESGRQKVAVTGRGTVAPAKKVVLYPEVAGRVIWRHDELLPGGRVKAGETLARIDPRDYQLALAAQEAAVERARLALSLERSNKAVAEKEFEITGSAPPQEEEARRLALREPHLQSARAELEAARSAAERARLNVSRTMVKAPFNALIQATSVEKGQLVTQQVPLATVVGTDHFWVQVSIPVERLGWIKVPGLNADEGSPARIVQRIGGRTIERSGRVIRLMGELDPMGRMARALVEIHDPLGLSRKPSGEQGFESDLPLLLGAYVHVEIEGSELEDVIELPRVALREGDQVFVMNGERKLEVRSVEVVWRREKSVLVRGGVSAGEKVIVSPLEAPVEGMLLRSRDDVAKGTESPERAARDGKKAEVVAP